MNCKVLIMNSKGSTIEGFKVGGMEIPKKRKDVRQKVIKDENPDLIFIQESDIVLRNICTQNFRYRDYQAIGGKDVGLLYDTTNFIVSEDPTNRLRKIYEYKCKRGEISSDEILPRMCARIMQGQNPNDQKFLCVSWHGPHTGKRDDEKQVVYDDLCLLIKTYSVEKKIPIILGGDFNLDLSKLTSPLKLHDYVKLGHRPNKLDYILTSRTINNVRCRPVDILGTIDILFPELSLSNLNTFLDHDPLVVNVNIPKTNGVTSSATVLVIKVNYAVTMNVFQQRIILTLMQKMIKDKNPDLILLQESNFPLESICTQKLKKRNYKIIKRENNDAAIIYDSKRFKLCKSSLNTKFKSDSKYYNLIKRRMCAAKLKEKVLHAQQFLCVSWQGPYRKFSYNDKKRVYRELTFIHLYLEEKQIPVVFGGDFNLDLSTILPVSMPIPTPLLHSSLIAKDYKLLAHRENKYVFTLRFETITNVNCKTVDIFKMLVKARESILKLILDHDPLAVNLTIYKLKV